MFYDAFKWLLNKGIAGAAITLNLIFYAVFAVAMAVLHWYHKNH